MKRRFPPHHRGLREARRPVAAAACRALALGLVGLAATVGGTSAQQAEETSGADTAGLEGYTLADDADYGRDLRAASQNPVADLISLPIQNNVNFGVGPRDRTGWVTNIQPVIPFNLTEDVNLITRTILPVVGRPSFAPGDGGEVGLGDLNPSLFLSPKDPIPFAGGQLIWGAGASFLLPTATDSTLGTGKVAIGPSAVGLVLRPPWVVGALASTVWSVAGPSGRDDVALTVVQPFVNYNLDRGWFLTTSPIITANWEADGDRWTVPVGGGVGRVFAIGRQPVNMSLQAFGNVVSPDDIGPDWSIRFSLTLLFPR